MFQGKPIIGIAGGIGSGKSLVARLFGEMGCVVIDSDEQVRRAYEDPRVKQALRAWWGDDPFLPGGEINKRRIGELVFAQPDQRRRLESLLHPIVAERREAQMRAAADDPQVLAYVWDTPLLFETGLHARCDAVVFIDAPFDVRLERVQRTRGWDEAELTRRQNLQWPLDKKGEISDYVIRNTTADVTVVREQVREALSRILSGTSNEPAARAVGEPSTRTGHDRGRSDFPSANS